MAQINRIRGDLVTTIRQVVEIISNYAGSALPEPARTRVREFILSLPQRWTSASQSPGETTAPSTSRPRDDVPGSGGTVVAESSGREELKGKRRARGGGSSSRSTIVVGIGANKRIITSSASERVGETPLSPSSSRKRSEDTKEDAESANMNASARRILTLATESLDMLHNVTHIFDQSLQRAEA